MQNFNARDEATKTLHRMFHSFDAVQLSTGRERPCLNDLCSFRYLLFHVVHVLIREPDAVGRRGRRCKHAYTTLCYLALQKMLALKQLLKVSTFKPLVGTWTILHEI